MRPVESPHAPSFMASPMIRCICVSSAPVGGRRAKPMAAMRSVPWPTSWTTFNAVPSRSNACKYSPTERHAKSIPVGM